MEGTQQEQQTGGTGTVRLAGRQTQLVVWEWPFCHSKSSRQDRYDLKGMQGWNGAQQEQQTGSER